MTIKELRDKIADLPDNMEVGTYDHFGGFVEADVDDFYCGVNLVYEKIQRIFHIPAIDIGDEPD